MTLVVVSTEADHATIMSDTLSVRFDDRQAWVGEEPKVALLPDINAAVAFRGHAGIGAVWAKMAVKRAGKVADFDEFTAAAQVTLQAIMAHVRSRPWFRYLEELGGSESTRTIHAYLVGWSPRHGRFKAYIATPTDDFAPVDITDQCHLTPAPPGVQPTDTERRMYEVKGHPLPVGEPVQVPTSTAGWAELARSVHRGRAVRRNVGIGEDPWQVLIGGSVHLTRLSADGEAVQEKIHEFDAEDFRAAFVGSFHPIGQLSPCPCGSKRRYLDCHITLWQELPCHCQSGKTLADCCKLDLASSEACEVLVQYPDLAGVGQPAPTPSVGKVGRNAACPCGSGSKFKKCCALVSA